MGDWYEIQNRNWQYWRIPLSWWSLAPVSDWGAGGSSLCVQNKWHIKNGQDKQNFQDGQEDFLKNREDKQNNYFFPLQTLQKNRQDEHDIQDRNDNSLNNPVNPVILQSCPFFKT